MTPQDGNQENVALDVFTSAGLFRGRLRIPRATTLLDHLNRAGEHLRLAEAHVEGDALGIHFLAVRRESVRIVVPIESHGVELAAPHAEEDSLVDVAGVMDSYRFRGRVRLAPGQRLTDFLATAPAFVAVRSCSTWRSGTDSKPRESEIALIRAHAVVAFSDTLE